MKIQVFPQTSPHVLQSIVNEWLEEHRNAEVILMNQTEHLSEATNSPTITLTFLYREG